MQEPKNVGYHGTPLKQLCVKGILQDLLARSALNFEKKYNFDMIVIHIGILIYPVKDTYERV